ncbi:hypothetical protein BH10ACI1_BH10ACI1_18910 [soil metagenome]
MKPPKEQLEKLQSDLENILESQNPLRLLFEKISSELIVELDQSAYKKEHWNTIQENFWSAFDYHFQLTFQHYFRYSLLFCLLSDSHSNVFDRKYLRDSKKEFGLETNGKLQKALMKTLDRCFFDEVKRGGKKGTLDDGKKLLLLALYNRFSIIIKNARNDFKKLKKTEKAKREIQIKRDIMKKYKIPEIHIESLFSIDSAGDTALSWAKQKLETNLSFEYLNDFLTEARKKWKSRGLIIGCKNKPGKVFYTIDPSDEQKKKSLKFEMAFSTPIHALFSNTFLEAII